MELLGEKKAHLPRLSPSHPTSTRPCPLFKMFWIHLEQAQVERGFLGGEEEELQGLKWINLLIKGGWVR